MRRALLTRLYTSFPFDLKGDCPVPPAREGIKISCIINFYGRLNLLAGILHSLAQQRYDRERFEVILIEDGNGSDAGKRMAEEFGAVIQTSYFPLQDNFGKMGASRNYGLSCSGGEIVLFLDDDTVIQQDDFLFRLEHVFESNPQADAVVPHGHASYAQIEGRYDYHDPFFMTSRCTAYRREVLKELGGFMSDFIGQEDVEFVIRFILAGKKSLNCCELEYFHPPLLVRDLRKPMAVGMSFSGLRKRYSKVLWILTILNCIRHAPLYLLPGRRNREMGRFGVGFFLGVLRGLFGGRGLRYG